MNDLDNIISSLVSTALLIGSLWWANAVLRNWVQTRPLGLSAPTRLFAVLVLGGLVYTPLRIIASGFIALFADYYGAGAKILGVLGSIAVLAFLGWLYTRFILEP